MPPDPKRLYESGLKALKSRQFSEARGAFEAVLAQAPNAPEPLFQLGRALAGEGNLGAAEATLRRALKAAPQEAAIWQALHGVLSGQARKALEREAARARIPLGTEAEIAPILRQLQKDPAAAEAAALALVRRAPVAAYPAYALGAARLALGKSAVAPLEAALARAPDYQPARRALAEAHAALGAPRRAASVLEGAEGPEAARIRARLARDIADPEAAVAHLAPFRGQDAQIAADLALSLAQCGRGEEARAAAETAIAKGAASAALSRNLAQAAEQAGDIATAETLIDSALAAGPSASLLIHRAQLRQSAGEFAEAEAELLQALDCAPQSGEAFRALVNARKIAVDDPVNARLAAALERPDLSRADRRGLHFAAAKLAGDQGRSAEVMDHLHRANRLMAADFPYGFQADLDEARALAADWPKLRPVVAQVTDPSDPVLFVTGLPRSGTTLVETILAVHPQVASGGEMPFMGRALLPAIEALRAGEAEPTEFAEAGARYLRAARRKAGDAPVILDKAISTFSRIGHVAAALPAARFVLVSRDPRDTGLSLYRNAFPEGTHRYAYDLAPMGRYIRLHDALVAFWRDVLPDRVHVVDYDALTAEPEAQIRALLEAVGLPFDPACLAPEASGHRIQTLSFAQARQPIGRGSVGGWRRFEADLRPLIKALQSEIDLHPSLRFAP